MPDFDHPAWCSPRRCTAAVPPVDGYAVAVHRSKPQAAGLTEFCLVQSPRGYGPQVEVSRDGRTVLLPLGEAGGAGPAVEDLLRLAGVRR